MRPYELREAVAIDYVPMELVVLLTELWESCDDFEYDDSHRDESLRIMKSLQKLREYKYPIGKRE